MESMQNEHEAELRRAHTKIASLEHENSHITSAAQQQIASATNMDAIFDQVVNQSKSMVGADRASLFILDEASDELFTRAADGTSHIRIHVDQGIVGAVASQHDVLCISDAYSDSCFNPTDLKTGYKTTSILALPIFDPQHNLVGVLQLLEQNPQELLAMECFFDAKFCITSGKILYIIFSKWKRCVPKFGNLEIIETDGNALTGDGGKASNQRIAATKAEKFSR